MFDPSIIFSSSSSSSFQRSILSNMNNSPIDWQNFAQRQREEIERNENLLISRVKYLKILQNKSKEILWRKIHDEQKKMFNIKTNSSVDLLKEIFQRDEQQLNLTIKKIDELTKHLDQLRKSSTNKSQIEKLTQELKIRNELNEEQCRKIVFQRDLIQSKEKEFYLLNQRIDEIRRKNSFQFVELNIVDIENQMNQLAQSFDSIANDLSTSNLRFNDDFVSIQFNPITSNVKKRHSIDSSSPSIEIHDDLSTSDTEEDDEHSICSISTLIEMKDFQQLKSSLKTCSTLKNSTRHVIFDPFILLLDAAVTGDLQLLIQSANKVKNLSQPNDEGLTALHNAVCAANFDCVKFLVDAGCDVNAADNDGWTPLHCAASCNNKLIVEYLIEHGASIFARTFRDEETPKDKCEQDDEDFQLCFEYLQEMENRLGVTNDRFVYALYDYDPTDKSVDDELKFSQDDQLTILRRDDENETEWWWAKHSLNDHEGFVPRNYLGISRRVHHQSTKIIEEEKISILF